jgi:translation initiation factor IF-2
VKVEEPPPPEVKEEEEMMSRAPIVTIMGHVDHGKTSILDHIRKARVAAGEAGGITQHIGAYQIEHDGKLVTFLDTPGHQAFTAMRARGANVTDIVILVIAADDGMMPQTIEAMNHAKAAGVEIIVAINKVDLPTAQVDRVKAQLQENDLSPEDWGGNTICVETSAATGLGLDTLLEMIFLQSEILELETPANADPRGTVIEAQMESGRGATATIVVTHGRVEVGQSFICGRHWGKVKGLINDAGRNVLSAEAAMPVKVLGFNGLPEAGDEFVVMEDEKAARTLSEDRLADQRTEKLAAPKRATLEDLFGPGGPGAEKKKLQLIIKADVQGSLEATVQSLKDIKSDKVELDIIHAAAGPVSESDILLASASDAIVLGFNVKLESTAVAKAKSEGVQVKLYSIIYELIDQVKQAMLGLLDPEHREKIIGHAECKEVFDLSRGTVAGCIVTDGRIDRNARARVVRKRQSVYDGHVATLKRFKDDVKEVRLGLECGIKLGDYSDYEVGDIIECYMLERVEQSL